MKFYKTTDLFDLFLDGDGEMKHVQSGRVLDEHKQDTGITWWWRQTSKGQQHRGFQFAGQDYDDWEAVKAAYLASRPVDNSPTKPTKAVNET